MNQTLWITPNGQMISCPPNGHYDYIRQNFVNFFGKQPLNESEIHDEPYKMGWVHIQNHFGTFNVRGHQCALSRNKRIIRDLIFERLLGDRNFTVNIENNNKAMINPYGSIYIFNMPDQYDELKQFLL
jgi:hypothetical protein